MRSPGLIKDLIGVIIVMRFRRGIAEETRNSERGRGEWEWLGRIDFERSFGTSYNTRCKYLTERIYRNNRNNPKPVLMFLLFDAWETLRNIYIYRRNNLSYDTFENKYSRQYFLKKIPQISQRFSKIKYRKSRNRKRRGAISVAICARTYSYNLYIAVERIRFSSESWTRSKSASISWDGPRIRRSSENFDSWDDDGSGGWIGRVVFHSANDVGDND